MENTTYFMLFDYILTAKEHIGVYYNVLCFRLEVIIMHFLNYLPRTFKILWHVIDISEMYKSLTIFLLKFQKVDVSSKSLDIFIL